VGREGRKGSREEKERQVSTPTTSYHTTLFSHFTLYITIGGGHVIPQHSPPPPAAKIQPETKPLQLSFGFLARSPLSPCIYEHTAPPPPPIILQCFFTQHTKTKPLHLVSWFLAPSPCHLMFANAQPHHNHTSPHHLPSVLSTAISHSTPKIELLHLVSQFLATSPL
jgi:hypothetical protein